MINKTIYLNSGHSLTDPGSVTLYGKETYINMAIRNALVSQLERQGFKVERVPDILNLKDSIAWVNEKAKGLNDGLALSIHANCCKGIGAETYYYKTSNASMAIAKELIDAYCREMGMVNRGAKSSSSTRFGRLGWIEDTNCWAILIEVGFLDNKGDVKLIKDYEKTAKAICKGINAIYGIEYKETKPKPLPNNNEKIRALAQEIINLTN